MKNVLITGGTNGIGRAVVDVFLKNGYRVFVFYKSDDITADELKKLGVNTYKADISDFEAVSDAVLDILEKYSHIDVLVNNAGIAEQRLFVDITPADWKRMCDVNLDGVYNVTSCVVKNMIKNGKGSIVNVSSIWGQYGASCEVHYSAAKAGVIGFTKALAKELGLSKIRVNAVAPGIIDTNMNGHLSDEDIEEIVKEIPVGRVGTAIECAELIYFLSSEDASYITGQTIGINGGWAL